jgi:hypothetical protein
VRTGRSRRLASESPPGVISAVSVALVVGTIAFLLGAALVGAVNAGVGTGSPGVPEEGRCVRWYPDYCVPADRGALDCDDLPTTPLRVDGADPFDFDRDLDGTGCEAG